MGGEGGRGAVQDAHQIRESVEDERGVEEESLPVPPLTAKKKLWIIEFLALAPRKGTIRDNEEGNHKSALSADNIRVANHEQARE